MGSFLLMANLLLQKTKLHVLLNMISSVMANSLYETHLQGIMVVVFIKTTIQLKMMKTTTCTMIPGMCIS